MAEHDERTIATLDGVARRVLAARRGGAAACPRQRRAYRPEEAGGWALPQGEFGLAVRALVARGVPRAARGAPNPR